MINYFIHFIFLSALQGGDNSSVLAAGLPNITGYWNEGTWASNDDNFGACYRIESKTVATANTAGLSGLKGIDASRSNSIYGNSETVQPPAFALIPQIKF